MAYSKQSTDRFLLLYRELEKIRDTEPAIYDYYEKKDARSFDLYRRLRNQLSHIAVHGEYPFIVSDALVNELEELIREMGLSAFEIANKTIHYATEKTSLGAMAKYLGESGHTYLPIYDSAKRIIGVATSQSLLALTQLGVSMEEEAEKHLSRFHLANQKTRFSFFAREDPAYLVEQDFALVKDGKRLGIGFVTEHGNPSEAILGLVTVYDVLKK